MLFGTEGIGAMISNGGVDFIADGRYKYIKAPRQNPSRATFPLDSLSSMAVRTVSMTSSHRVAIKRSIKSERVASFLQKLRRDHSRLLPPEQVRSIA